MLYNDGVRRWTLCRFVAVFWYPYGSRPRLAALKVEVPCSGGVVVCRSFKISRLALAVRTVRLADLP